MNSKAVSGAETADFSILKAKKKPFDLFRLLRYVKISWVLIALALATSITGAIVSSKIPDQTANLFNGDFSMDKLWAVINRTLICMGIDFVTYFLSLFAQARSTLTARKSIWKKLMNTKLAYYDANDPGSLLNTVTADAELVGAGFVSLFVAIPGYITYIISCVQIISLYNSSLLIMVLSILAIHLIYMAFMGQWIQGVSRDAQIQSGLYTGFLAERVRNFPMIKAFSTQKEEMEKGTKESEKVYKIGKRSAKAAGAQTAYAAFCFVLTTVISTIWGTALIRDGKITNYQFIGAYTYIVVINVIFMAIGIYWTALKVLNGEAFRIARLCESPQETEKSGNANFKFEKGDLKFNNVNFFYNQDKQIIKNVSFTFPMGKVSALVGPSGSGKTTIFKLLEGLYAPTSGTILNGQQNISSYNVQDWRKKLAYVVQDAGIFSGTLKECLCYGVGREVKDEELIAVAKATGLYDFVESQPLKFLTPVAAWGCSLSGGQRQRVVIARALLRKADVLIFDEPTSALDAETANAISKLIFDSFKDKTVIIISHELNYITKADNIIFLNNGSVEAQGTHEQLMDSCETYRSLVNEQSYQEVFE